MVFQDPSLRGLAVGGQAARHPVAPGSMPPAAMADFAMDLLLGGGGPARASSMRTSSWSDDGQQAAGGNAGATLAGKQLLSTTFGLCFLKLYGRVQPSSGCEFPSAQGTGCASSSRDIEPRLLMDGPSSSKLLVDLIKAAMWCSAL